MSTTAQLLGDGSDPAVGLTQRMKLRALLREADRALDDPRTSVLVVMTTPLDNTPFFRERHEALLHTETVVGFINLLLEIVQAFRTLIARAPRG